MNTFFTRKMDPSEALVLEEMLYLALYLNPGQEPYPKSIIFQPELNKYIKNWGSQKGDLAMVALWETDIIAACWGRIFTEKNPGYGFVDANTPEISMAVKPKYRNKGVGQALLKALEEEYRAIGIKQISLSVHKNNAAKRLYVRNGFSVYSEQDSTNIMLKILKQFE